MDKEIRNKFQIRSLLFATISFSFIVLAMISVSNSIASESIKKANAASISKTAVTQNKTVPNKIIAYYFHGNARCRSCLKIEKLSKEAIDEKFKDELQKGTLEWRVVNFDEENNKHFIKDYNLYTKSVILSLNKGGQQKNWKNLDKVWEYLGDEKQFESYVQKEVAQYVGEIKL